MAKKKNPWRVRYGTADGEIRFGDITADNEPIINPATPLLLTNRDDSDTDHESIPPTNDTSIPPDNDDNSV